MVGTIPREERMLLDCQDVSSKLAAMQSKFICKNLMWNSDKINTGPIRCLFCHFLRYTCLIFKSFFQHDFDISNMQEFLFHQKFSYLALKQNTVSWAWIHSFSLSFKVGSAFKYTHRFRGEKQNNTTILYKHVGTLLIELIHFLKENCISKWKDWFSCKNILNPSTRHLDIIRKKKIEVKKPHKAHVRMKVRDVEAIWSTDSY